MYGEFSTVYDRLMRDVDYDEWASYLYALLTKNGCSPDGSMYECCCGTGQITLRLASYGFAMVASDMSEDMLMIARERCRCLGRRITFLCQDMRHISLHRPVDAIIACCDGVNYLTGRNDLDSFLLSASGSLKAGGLLLFDISSEYKLSCILGMNTFGEDEDEICYFWKNMYDDKTRLAELSISCFVKRPDGAFKRIQEKQIQRAYSVNEIVRSASDARFEPLGIYRFGSVSCPEDHDERIQFVFRKKD